tara:strand:- start:188 stop:556 length:369 start_codon:yes stop_codon:yes gene_type:complete
LATDITTQIAREQEQSSMVQAISRSMAAISFDTKGEVLAPMKTSNRPWATAWTTFGVSITACSAREVKRTRLNTAIFWDRLCDEVCVEAIAERDAGNRSAGLCTLLNDLGPSSWDRDGVLAA